MEISKKTIRNIFLCVIGCIFFYWLLHETERVDAVFGTIKNVLSPFVIGAVLAFIINVPMRSFENRLGFVKADKLRRVLALIITIIVVLLVLAFVFYLLIPQVLKTAKTFVDSLPTFFGNVQKAVSDFLSENPNVMEWVSDNTDFENLDIAGLIQKVVDMVSDSVTAIIAGAFTAIGNLAGFLVNAVISIVFAIYCLFQKETLARQGRKLLYAYSREKVADDIIRILRLSNSTFSNFLSGQCVEVCILGSLFAVTMAIFRMPYIPLVSVLVAVTAFIPIVGAFVGCFFGALFILVDNPAQAVGFVVMFLILQQIENNLIYPKVVGTSIGLSGMWVLVAVAVGGELMGVIGMFLMIPMTSVIHAVMREITEARLTSRQINDEKLVPQPPELRSHLKEKSKRVLKKHIQWFKKKDSNDQKKDSNDQ